MVDVARSQYEGHNPYLRTFVVGTVERGRVLERVLTTTTAAQQILIAYPIPANSARTLDVRITAYNGGDRASWALVALIHRAAGDAAIQGSLVNVFAPILSTGATLGGWAATVSTGADEARVLVTGQSGVQIEWHARALVT